MRTIYRYGLDLVDLQTVDLPDGAEILHVAQRIRSPHNAELWARVDPDQPLRPRQIRVAGTGHPLDDRTHLYLGTLLVANESLVFHVFEVTA